MVFDCEKHIGECQAQCCSLHFFSKSLWFEKKEKARNVTSFSFVKNKVLVLTSDMKCCFLDRERLKCLIYPDRPSTCSRFGLEETDGLWCPFQKVGGGKWSVNKKKGLTRRLKKVQRKNLKFLEGLK